VFRSLRGLEGFGGAQQGRKALICQVPPKHLLGISKEEGNPRAPGLWGLKDLALHRGGWPHWLVKAAQTGLAGAKARGGQGQTAGRCRRWQQRPRKPPRQHRGVQ
jgi:hypothetical protein